LNVGVSVGGGSSVIDNAIHNSIALGISGSGIWPIGFKGNVITENNTLNINPQVSGVFSIGTNICGPGTSC
jgi:hypothetical protein